MDWHIVRASIRLVSATLHIPRLFLAIIAISFFWSMGAVLAAQFPPLVKNALGADQQVATLFLGDFLDRRRDRLGRGQPAAQRTGVGRYSPVSAIFMGLFVLDLYPPRERLAGRRPRAARPRDIPRHVPGSWLIVLDLLGVAIAGGMFVVPLYAFLTTTVPKSETARTIAANNIVNSGCMVAATVILTVAVMLGVTVDRQPADRRHRQHRRGLARLEAAPRLRLSRGQPALRRDRRVMNSKPADEGRREQPRIVGQRSPLSRHRHRKVNGRRRPKRRDSNASLETVVREHDKTLTLFLPCRSTHFAQTRVPRSSHGGTAASRIGRAG